MKRGKVMLSKKAKLFTVLCAAAMLMASCSSGGESKTETSTGTTGGGDTSTASQENTGSGEPVTLTALSMYFTAEVPNRTDVLDKIAELTGYNLDITWVPSTGYNDKLSTMIASDALPMLTVVSDLKATAFVSACRSGMFWQVDDYIDDYEGLSSKNPDVYDNTRVDGNLYGIYRHRALVRQGIIYRADWLEEEGLSVPKTPDEMMNVIRVFSERCDYGVALGGQGGLPEGIGYMAIWNGAPNGWGVADDGKVKPAFFFDEYKEAMDWFRDMYAEGLINQNFAELTAEDAKKLVNTEQTGFAFIYVDDIVNRFNDLAVKNPDAKLDFSLDLYGNDNVKRSIATAGYNGVIAMSKTAVPDEETLRQCLDYIDKTATPEFNDLMLYGIEGVDHKITDGKFDTTDQAMLENYSKGANQYMQLAAFDTNNIHTKPVITSEIQMKVYEEEGGKHDADAVHNVTQPYLSQSWTEMGGDLNQISNDAITKYIMGVIDEAGWEDAKQTWLDQGGQAVIDEYTEAYNANN